MTTAVNIDELYTRHIRQLPPADRLRLLALLAHDLATWTADQQKSRSILELEGVGAALWQGVEAQTYVNELRDEWDRRP